MRVLVTGANRGIGAGLLKAYAAAGDEAIGTARRPEGDLLPLDVTDPAGIAALAARLADRPLDLLICNAGIYPDKGRTALADYPPALWAEAFATNVTGAALTVAAFLPGLRKARGRIALLSSAMASDARAPGGSYAYRASKAALLNLGRNLAADLRADGVAVGIYHPGWVMTDMGGPGATLPLDRSVAGLVARFAALSPATTGVFEDWEGKPIPF